MIDPCIEANIEHLNIAYAYDNDGDPEPGSDFGLSSKSPIGAFGVRVLRAGQALRPDGTLSARQSFNWWIADSTQILDWGPQKAPGRINIYNGRGQPAGDRMRYHYLSNREIDYDQVMSAFPDPSTIDTLIESGWLPPLQPFISAADVANGADSRFLISVGPFDLGPGESVPVTIGLFTAPSFHRDPENFARSFPTPSDFQKPANIISYKDNLDRGGLFSNARMVKKIFDNDTERFTALCSTKITNQGITLRYNVERFHGDGVPDFKGPIPPPFPKVEFATGEGEATIRWFGRETENARDPISGLQDFEGYTLQMSPDGISYTIIGYYDRVNYRGWYLDRDVNGDGIELEHRWVPLPAPPLLYDEIQSRYALNWDTCLNKPGNIVKPIDPEKYSGFIIQGRPLPITPFPNAWCTPDTGRTAVRVRFCNDCGPFGQRKDTILTFFKEGLNLGLDAVRMYPNVTDTANDSSYWYQYKISGLFPSQPVYFAVVPFDNGMVTFHQTIEPQTASPYAGAYLVYPIATDSTRRADRLKISVYPNPYRIDHDYSFFEKRLPVTGHPQSRKRLNFVNLPSRCTLRIYTLDGDLVQQINHDKDPNASDSGYDFWDLLSRNAQPVAAGLYIYVVESNEGRYVGKIIIIQ